ncbi:S-layer protein [Methanoplanus sp. FWC-SCC4]|uniref:S-layer protein n=1 Tax=Methanochimaera problematica TaxID=2609417 RepID=A0AA97I408_9EURY|nr:S-layer protein [Methanoplanus sp. FWC-SCC4]WOF17233.1 S-layer protein [Methanoplanus sp. FWC-SCC4]
MRKIITLTALVLVFLSAAVTPCLAGDKYYTDGPVITVSVSGSNELLAGADSRLNLLVQNKGLIDMKLVQNRYMTPDYLPNSAKSVVVTLKPGDSPAVVKSDPQVIGDLSSGLTKTGTFDVYIPEGAKSGRYSMTAVVEYEYMENSEQVGTDAISYYFKTVRREYPVSIVIRPSVVLEISDVVSDSLNAGGEGYIEMTIKNTGTDDGRNTAIYISPTGYSPITPIEDSIYAGDFKKGDVITPRFKVSVSKDADPQQEYPLRVFAVYKDYEGKSAKSAPVTVGVSFGGRIKFEAVSGAAVAYPGRENLIHVTYKNTGDATAYQALGRISVIDPFSSGDSNVYLGDMLPGETKEAVYKISADSGATIKEYSLESEIRYNDIEGNNYVSDTVKVIISVQPDSAGYLYIGIPVIAVILGAGFFVYRRKNSA